MMKKVLKLIVSVNPCKLIMVVFEEYKWDVLSVDTTKASIIYQHTLKTFQIVEEETLIQ
jgi:hypothetical protein